MPSTFTTNGGIELPANGEQDGIWGDTVNDNMQIIDRLTNGVGAIALSGTTHILTTLDGDVSDGHYAVLVFGGSPSGANTVTISPNDAQHVYIVSNTTAESVVLTQGSGGNVTVPAGKSAIVACDGAGAGAAVTDITTGFTFQASSAALTALAALAVTDGNFIVGNGTTWVAESGNTVLTSIGVTATTAELNIMDGVTATTAEINILSGVTATAAELNLVDGSVAGTIVNSKSVVYGAAGEVNATTLQIAGTSVTSTAAELNILDGVTATAAELNVLDGISGIASQADAEAGTATDKLITPLSVRNAFNATGTAPVYACRAWVNFNGTGTVAIRASGNVSSITDNGLGDYTVNFSTAMQDDDYAVSGAGQMDTIDANAGARVFGIRRTSTAMQTTSCRVVMSIPATDGGTDCTTVCVAIFR
jgi:hypothetical protein